MKWRVLLLIGLLIASWVYGIGVEEARFRAGARDIGLDLGWNYSDLYPRWRGAVELFQHGRDPYSVSVTADIHQGLTGQPAVHGDKGFLADGFAYPLPLALILAPLTVAPYEVLLPGLYAGAGLLLLVSVLAWCDLVGWPARAQYPLVAAFGLSSLPAIQALIRLQPTLLSVGCVAGGVAALGAAHRRAAPPLYALAGVLLAMALVKPQCALLVSLVFGLWVLGDWRRRAVAGAAFVLTLAAGSLLAEVLLPNWIGKWQAALAVYQQVSNVAPLVTAFVSGPALIALYGVGGAGLLAISWRLRKAEPGTLGFAVLIAWPLLLSYLVFPSWQYQQVLLYPAVLLILAQAPALINYGRVGRTLSAITRVLVGWPFLVAAGGALLLLGGVLWHQPQWAGAAETLDPAIWLMLIGLALFLPIPLGVLTHAALVLDRGAEGC